MKATIQKLKAEAAKIGAVVCVGDYDGHDQSTRIEVEAADGMKWSESGTQIIHAFKFRYIKGSSEEAYRHLIHLMTFGLEPLTEEDS